MGHPLSANDSHATKVLLKTIPELMKEVQGGLTEEQRDFRPDRNAEPAVHSSEYSSTIIKRDNKCDNNRKYATP